MNPLSAIMLSNMMQQQQPMCSYGGGYGFNGGNGFGKSSSWQLTQDAIAYSQAYERAKKDAMVLYRQDKDDHKELTDKLIGQINLQNEKFRNATERAHKAEMELQVATIRHEGQLLSQQQQFQIKMLDADKKALIEQVNNMSERLVALETQRQQQSQYQDRERF